MKNKKNIFATAENFDRFSLPHLQFYEVDWIPKIISLSISSEGSTGVIFIETKAGSIVFKSIDEVPIDLFINQFAKRLLITVPKIRSISWDSKEFQQMMQRIKEHCLQDQPFHRRIVARLNRPYYEILQYIPNITLKQIGPKRFNAIFSQTKHLKELGGTIALDILLNNSDRFYLFWDTEGNIQNLLFSIKLKSKINQDYLDMRNEISQIEFSGIIPIDTRPTIMDAFNKYSYKNFNQLKSRINDFLTNLLKFISPISHQKQSIPQEFLNLNTQFQLYTETNFTVQQLQKIGRSIIFTLNKFISLGWKEYAEIIKTLKKQGQEWEITYWNDSLNKLYQNYFVELLKTLEIFWENNQNKLYQIFQQQVSHNQQGVVENKNSTESHHSTNQKESHVKQ